MQMEEHKPLAPFTTFGIGGPARWFTRAQNEDDIVAASEWARCHAVPLFVLGGGSNLLVADTGFDGLVLHIALTGLESHSENNKTIFRVAAGEDWDTFVQRTVEANCSGLECLADILAGKAVDGVTFEEDAQAQAVTALSLLEQTQLRETAREFADEVGEAEQALAALASDAGTIMARSRNLYGAGNEEASALTALSAQLRIATGILRDCEVERSKLEAVAAEERQQVQ